MDARARVPQEAALPVPSYAHERRGSLRPQVLMAMRTAHALALTAALAAAVVAVPREAQADEVTPTAKGIVGTALLGGEVVVFAEAIFGVRSPAAYLIGAGAGAVAGGVGGYFIEQAVDDGRIPAYLLAGGLALLI